jgi:hypothetical protein
MVIQAPPSFNHSLSAVSHATAFGRHGIRAWQPAEPWVACRHAMVLCHGCIRQVGFSRQVHALELQGIRKNSGMLRMLHAGSLMLKCSHFNRNVCNPPSAGCHKRLSTKP